MFKKIALSAALAMLSSSAVAAGAVSYYGGAYIGLTKFDDINGNKTSIGGFIGVQLTDNFALEGAYRRLGEFDVRAGTMTVNVATKQAALSLVGSWPMANGVTAFGRLGYNRLEAEASVANFNSSETTNKALYGAGFSYPITPVMIVRVEATKPASDTTNFSIGVAFKF